MDKNTEDTEKRLADINTAIIWIGDAKEWMDVAERLDRESGRGQNDTATNHHKLNVSLICTGVAFELAYKSLLVAELKRPKKTQRIEKLHKMLKAETQRTIEDWIKEAGWKESDDLLKYLDKYMVPPDRKYSMENAREKEKQSLDFTPTRRQAIPELAPVLYKLADLGEQNLTKARDTSEPNQSTPQDDLDRILEIIREIVEKSASGEHIYRGEAEHYDKVSSTLYREYEEDIEAEHFDIEITQKEMLKEAQDYIDETNEAFEILTLLQHYEGKTNLIDFTTDFLIALFFACYGSQDKPGRVILLEESAQSANRVEKPRNIINRVRDQKSVFARPPKGFIEPEQYKEINIPKSLKQPMLNYLDKYHRISTETIYNDLHGFIRVQHLHKNAYTEFFKGLTCQHRGDHDKAIEHYTEALKRNPLMVEVYNNRGLVYKEKGKHDRAISDYTKAIDLNPNYADAYTNRGVAYGAKGEPDRAIEDHNKAIALKPDDADVYSNRGVAYGAKGEHDRAIEDYTKAIDLNPDFANAYYNRGGAYRAKNDYDRAIEDYTKAIDLDPNNAKAYYNRGVTKLHLQAWEKAKSDLTTARDMGMDIIATFRNNYENVADFEGKYGIQLPADIVAMLTPQ